MDFSYEEITGNPPPVIDVDKSDRDFFNGKKVMVTGAGGSVGSRVVMYLSKFENLQLLASDRDENSLHSLSLQISDSALFLSTQYLLLDIRDSNGVHNFFDEHQPDVVIHCAALKHLSILERHPREAYLTNVLGTNNLLQNAVRIGCRFFLNISTDKAVSPTSILGKSKRIAEKLVYQSRLAGFENFTSVRFGNVFASRGSVIETWVHQIKKGVPITLTDPRMQRYFMHLDEAASLAIKALVINAGPIHVLDMGKPLLMTKVIENLKNHFKSNVTINISGARKGEKISEEIMDNFAELEVTSHPKIRSQAEEAAGIEPFTLPVATPENDRAVEDLLEQLATSW